MKQQPRRQFLATTTKIATGAVVLPAWACSNSPKSTATVTEVADQMTTDLKLDQFGIQLYTLRDVLPKDPKGILKQVGAMGYTQIESYEGEAGMFWSMGPMEFKTYCADQGLTVVSSHCNINEDFEAKAAAAAEAGLQYLVCPWVGPQESMDEFKRLADQFNTCGAICKQNGLRFAYHNHGYSFETLDGALPQDLMMERTDPESVDFEMDIYWVVTAGADPVQWLKKYPGRWTLSHIKDRMKNVSPSEKDASCDLGTGSIDFPSILQVAHEQGMRYFILEQERYDNSTPIQSAKVGAEYLKQFS